MGALASAAVYPVPKNTLLLLLTISSAGPFAMAVGALLMGKPPKRPFFFLALFGFALFAFYAGVTVSDTLRNWTSGAGTDADPLLNLLWLALPGVSLWALTRIRKQLPRRR